ncbi:hypothetical protein [Aquimarina sp. Aq107]|uniref:hypothetical protein n=1 Tax=Aquimarina sp. Aq107 TaxID=1191912 RepID=UPI000D559004|nr:hypothetical protein [Aquimarina sp. Aq107]
MDKAVKNKLIRKLESLCPSSPAITTKKKRNELIEKLLILCPDRPHKVVSGTKLLEKMAPPLNPKT